MKKAFTLIEMLVVIGIIGLLMAVLLNVSTKVLDTGRNAKCMANMHNLAAACSSYKMSSGHYPLAGSYEQSSNVNENFAEDATSAVYDEHPGWISWYSQDKYPASEHVSESGWFTSTYSQNRDETLYCLSNGVLWRLVSGSRDIYRCPFHVNSAGAKPTWSYVMNCAFQWLDIDEDKNGYVNGLHSMGGPYRAVGDVVRRDKTLLFAEIQFKELKDCPAVERKTSPDTSCDCILQTVIDSDLYRGNFVPAQDGGLMEYDDGTESIGFNHGDGGLIYGHVCFVDGHVEKIRYPKSGMTDVERQELTKWLCNGVDISFNGSKYEEFK